MPELDQPRVLARALELVPLLEAWTRPYPSILPLRVPSVSLAAASILPTADIATQLLMTRLSMIFFALDDVIDGTLGSHSPAERYHMLDEIVTIVKSRGTEPSYPEAIPAGASPWDQVCHSLAALCRDVYGIHQERGFYPYFVKYVDGAMEGMKKELHWQQELKAGGPLPSYDLYMESAKISILAPAVMGLILSIQHEVPATSDRAALERQLDEITVIVGICVRLANDLRSYERERTIEKTPNAVWIRASSRGGRRQGGSDLGLEPDGGPGPEALASDPRAAEEPLALGRSLTAYGVVL